MSKKEDTNLIMGLLAWVVIILAVSGWVMNIVTICSSNFELNGMLICRIAGIFLIPLGAILGWI